MRSELDAPSGRGPGLGPLRIGGEFEVAPELLNKPSVPPCALPGAGYLATGRAALAAILEAAQRSRPGDTVLVPDYVCESVYQAVVGAGLRPVQYRVASDLSIDVDALVDLARERRGSVVAVLLVDYFGLSECDLWAAAFKRAFPDVPVVRDSVQALFEMDRRGADDFRFSSLRKWLPTPDGAPIVASDGSVLGPTEAEGDFVADKLLGNIERYWTRHAAPGSGDAAYAHLERGESGLEGLGARPAAMSQVSRVILSNIDLQSVGARRRNNFATLAELVSEYGLEPILGLADDRIPHFLPIRVKNRDEVRSTLREFGIYCPLHWPRHASASASNDLWESELSLVIDQRYGDEDMERLSAALKRCISYAP